MAIQFNEFVKNTEKKESAVVNKLEKEIDSRLHAMNSVQDVIIITISVDYTVADCELKKLKSKYATWEMKFKQDCGHQYNEDYYSITITMKGKQVGNEYYDRYA